MQHGKVLFFRSNGFGFIELADGSDVFVHRSNVAGNVKLNAGDVVEFEIGPARNDPNKTQAVNVKIIDRPVVRS